MPNSHPLRRSFALGAFTAFSLPLWPRFVAAHRDNLLRAGAVADWMVLPERGITGNTHMLMMDRNSDQVGALVQDWMTKQGLMK